MPAKFEYKSFEKQVLRDIERAEKRNRADAVRHVARAMKKNLSKRGVSRPGDFPGYGFGTLRKSIEFDVDTKGKNISTVGSTSSKMHLLEFGHGDGKTRNKRPVVFRTFREEQRTVEKIMRRKWL